MTDTRLMMLAKAIRSLTYSEMMELAEGLAVPADDGDYDITISSEMARLLHTWAENYVEIE